MAISLKELISVFNRIRDALGRTSAWSRASKGRHRRDPVTPARTTVVHLGRAVQRIGAARWDVLAGEETALVRPYVLAVEEGARCSPVYETNAAVWWVPAEAAL
jgi:ParB-like chromosome segregation protein Spo0J